MMYRRLFETPELLRIVAEQAESSRDAINLACVCRYSFTCCISIAWRHVSSAIQLFSLLPGARIEQSTEKTVVDLPESLTESDLLRFQFYAPFVKTLEITKRGTSIWRLRNWDWLFVYSRTRPLLPDLQTLTLTIDSRRLQCNCLPAPIWLTLFLSPSLLHFQAMSPPGYPDLTTPLGSYFVLRALANICPGLRTVGFFPTKHHVEEILTNGEWLYLLPFEERFINKDPYLDPLLARLNRLTSLRTQGWILELLPLDTLSRLEWLDVDMHGNSSGDVQILYAQLISIKHLGIFRCKKDDILQMLPKSDIMLTSIEIHTELDNDLVHRMTSSLATYCPLLLDLSLYCAGILQKIEITSIAPLALLPRFQRLRITYSDIVPPNASTDNIFSHINSLLPGLRALEFPHRVVRLSELRDIIHSMPKLERLALYIILEDPGNPELNQPNNSLRILASGFDWNLYLHGKNERDEIVENTVRFLSALCPNVRILFEPRPKQSSYKPKESAAIREVIGSINRCLALLAPSSRSLLYQSVLHPETAWPPLYS